MPEKRREDRDNVDALELLSGSVQAPQPIQRPPAAPAKGKPGSAAPSKTSAPPPIPAFPSAPAGASPPASASEVGQPWYRCLNCAYPIAEDRELRCNECGRIYDRDTLDLWFSGDERSRFDRVIWLVLAVLFVKLLLLPEFLTLARLAGAAAVGAACYVARSGKQQSTGGYYATGGMVVAGLMILGFAWGSNPLPYYALDIIAGCLLLLAMLHDPAGGTVGGVMVGRRLAPFVLFAAPLLAVGCWFLDQWFAGLAVGSSVNAPPGTPPALSQVYAPFLFVLPYLAAAGVWVFVWRTLAGVRKMLFETLES